MVGRRPRCDTRVMSTLRTERIDKRVRGRLGDTAGRRDPTTRCWSGSPGSRRSTGSPSTRWPPERCGRRAGRRTTGPSSSARTCRWRSGTTWWLGDDVVACGAWTLEDLPDRVLLTWEPGRLTWTEEDECGRRAPARPAQAGRDPAELAATWRCWSGRRWWRRATGRCCCWRPTCRRATTCRARTSGSTCSAPTDNVSACPYKGTAHAYWTFAGPPELRNVAWSYAAPLPGRRSRPRPDLLLQRARRPAGGRRAARAAGVAVQQGGAPSGRGVSRARSLRRGTRP